MYDLIVIGGGAAGIFSAINFKAFNSSKKVLVIEKSAKLLSKVRISGGGRCNVTHNCFEPRALIQHYPRGGKELLGPFHVFGPKQTIEWFESRGVKLKVEADGRIFPTSDHSQTIIDCLLNEASARPQKFSQQFFRQSPDNRRSQVDPYCMNTKQLAKPPVDDSTELSREKFHEELLRSGTGSLGVEIHVMKKVERIEKQQNFILHLKDRQLETHKLLLATGSSTQGFQWAEEFGHTIIKPVPSLFTFNVPSSPLKELSGITVESAGLKIGKHSQVGPLLITHFGFSGPAAIKLSAWAARDLAELEYRDTLKINWLSNRKAEEVYEKLLLLKQTHPQKTLAGENLFYLPKALWRHLVQAFGQLKDTPNKQLRQLAEKLCLDCYQVEGKTTNKEEFVTCGGVKLSEVDFKSMESKLCSGLYFAGEILNIDGVTGGFNFQNAWTGGYIAGSKA